MQLRAMKIGYGRVSTRDQNPGAQHDGLAAAGCDQVVLPRVYAKCIHGMEDEVLRKTWDAAP